MHVINARGLRGYIISVVPLRLEASLALRRHLPRVFVRFTNCPARCTDVATICRVIGIVRGIKRSTFLKGPGQIFDTCKFVRHYRCVKAARVGTIMQMRKRILIPSRQC